jgi:hypothetical protein
VRQASAHRLCAGHPQFGTLSGVEERGYRIECCAVEGKIDKALRQRLAAGQSDLAGGAAIAIGDEALEDAVDLVNRHVGVPCRVTFDRRFIFE